MKKLIAYAKTMMKSAVDWLWQDNARDNRPVPPVIIRLWARSQLGHVQGEPSKKRFVKLADWLSGQDSYSKFLRNRPIEFVPALTRRHIDEETLDRSGLRFAGILFLFLGAVAVIF